MRGGATKGIEVVKKRRGDTLTRMRLFSYEGVLLAALLTFAALMLWVLFGRSAKVGGDGAAVFIIAGAVLILVAVMASLHLS